MSRISLIALFTLFLNLSFAQINVQWEKRYDGTGSFIDQAVDLELDALGNTYVTGSSFNGTDYDWYTAKYDANGNWVWDATYGGSGLDEATSMVMDNSGDIIVTGHLYNSGSDWDIAVVKYDGGTGAELWDEVYTGSTNFDGGKDITVDASDNIFVTGTFSASASNVNWIVLKYNSGGTYQWNQSGGTADNDEGKKILTDATGNVYVAGHTEFSAGSTYFDFLVMKFNTAGTLLNSDTQDGGFNGLDTPNAMQLDGAGNIILGGQGFNGIEEEDYVLMKFSNTCVYQWTQTYSGDATGLDRINAVAVDQGTGDIYVTGRSKSIASGEDYYTIAYNSAGVEQWNKRYTGTGTGFDEATDIKLSGTGFLYLTGLSYESASNNDYTTVKYDVAGNLIWDTRFDGPSGLSDAAVKMRLDPSENIFITGSSHGGSTNLDYSTIKYCQLTTVASPDTALCLGQSVDLTATGGLTPTWAVFSGDMGSLSCTSCGTTTASPTVTSVYTVYTTRGSGLIVELSVKN